AIPEITWKEKTSGVNWLKDKAMLPSAIPNARIMRFGYDSMWLGHNPVRTNIRVIANNLQKELDWERQTLTLHTSGLVDSTVGIIFLGTPHSGTVSFTSRGVSTEHFLIAIAMHLELRCEPKVLSELESEYGTLLEVSEDFLDLCRSPRGVRLQVINFFEQRASKVGKQIGRDDLQEFVVDQVSATLGSYPSYGLPLDHYSLNKFASPDDGNFKTVQTEIAKLYIHALDRGTGSNNGGRDQTNDSFVQPSSNSFDRGDQHKYVGNADNNRNISYGKRGAWESYLS
ncbi:hypothetical protein PILCRDRAFT_79711, partial [Piloderma croceum F 1598]